MKIINIILGENDEFLRERAHYDSVINNNQRIITHIVPDKFKDDVSRLTDYVGEDRFQSGLSVEVSLSELLGILPRKRRRTDAYDALIKYLKDERNINLKIKSNRK